MTPRSILVAIPALAAVLVLGSGCATTKQLNEVRAIAQQAQQDAAEAKALAQDASQTADAAAQAADQANQQSMATDQKIDEMFKKAMMK